MRWCRKSAIAAVGLVVCVASLASCARPGSVTGNSGDIRVGATNVLSGAIASVCKPITDGANAWFKSVNARGGINGHKIKYTVLDDAYDPSRAASNARTLVTQKAVALVGGCGTANEQAAYSISSKSDVPLIGPYADLSSLLAPTTDNYFGLFPTYGAQDAAAIRAGLQRLGTGTVLHIAQNSAGVDAEDKVAEAAARQAHGRWLGNQLVDPTTTDYTPLALKVRSKHPDYILISAGDAQAAQIVLALKSQNVTPTNAYLTTFASTGALLSTVGEVLDDRTVSVTSPKLSADAQRSCVQVIRRFGASSDNDVHGVYGCSVAQILVAAMQKIQGRVTTKSLVAELNAMRASSSAPAFGPVTFTTKDHSGVSTATVYAVKGKSYVPQTSVPYGSD